MTRGPEQRSDGDIVEHRQAGKGSHDLECSRDPQSSAPVGRELMDRRSLEQHFALSRFERAADQADHCRFPGAIRSNETENFVTLQREADVINR